MSLLDSRFASLMDDSDEPLVGSQGVEDAPSLGQRAQLAKPLSTHDMAGSTTAESGNGEEGENVQQQEFPDATGLIPCVLKTHCQWHVRHTYTSLACQNSKNLCSSLY